MSEESYAQHLAGQSQLAAAAYQFGEIVAETDARREARAELKIHRFDSTAEARAACDRDEIADGDVLVVDSEQVVGFLVVAFPAAITEERGTFGQLPTPAHEYADGSYADSAHLAEYQARVLGAPVRIEHASSAILAHRADTVLIDTGDEHAHYADQLADRSLCEEYRCRDLDEDEAADRAPCKSCRARARDRAASREAALRAEEEAAAQEPARPEVSVPGTHTFDSSAEAYDASQCRDDIRDGDVLVVPSEGIVAILNRAWPAALTAVHGELHTLTAAAGDIEGGRYKASVEAAAQAAARLDVELAPLHRPVEPYAAGDRFVCSDGSTRTVAHAERGRDGHLWLHTAEGSAWRADRSEKVDVSRVDEAHRAARRAAAALRTSPPPADDEAAVAIRELGEALRYLAQASPTTLDDLSAGCTRRVVAELPRLAVVPGDIIHMLGVRLHVLDTGVQNAHGETPRWWAEVHGVDEADRRATYRAPWRSAIAVEHAAWDLLTVERLAPTQPF
ncbi:hypothetical protein E0L36_22120 [Streptomyces sp. AJS327]|uniref:hypothetical protein n=1 Tax=Streptomyces sp. AJS327 TaxID=2545265 RepID=UPI0015DFDF1B|nr:hypothetical protein [Streptomyces sp. AJS327]MBA0053474.1 hypothetical protein [Streptomyces sp. AJS327]